MIGFTTGGFITLLVITFGLIIGGYLIGLIAWYVKNREAPEARGVRGVYGGKRGPRAEAATGRHSESVIPGSGHA